jgi:hypothetical protein
MFELGMRLAFDKPTIIIKDNKTNYSFDTAPIEHLEYPQDLRYSSIVDFKVRLTEKIKSTFEKSQSDPQYSTFLKSFGDYKIPKLEKSNISKEDYIIEELGVIRRLLRNNNNLDSYKNYSNDNFRYSSDLELNNSIRLVEEVILNIYGSYEDFKLAYYNDSQGALNTIQNYLMNSSKAKISSNALTRILNNYV